MSLSSRLDKVEQTIGNAQNQRQALSHAQLVRAAAGDLPTDEMPEAVLGPGERSVAELIGDCLPGGVHGG